MYCFSLHKFHGTAWRIAISFVIATGCSQALAQTQDDYLNSLDGEASSVELDEQTRASAKQGSSKAPGVATSAVGQDGNVVSGIVPGMSIEQFEQALEKHYIGSFLFYKRLSDSQKQEVYSAYQSNPDPTSIRDTILKVRKQ